MREFTGAVGDCDGAMWRFIIRHPFESMGSVIFSGDAFWDDGLREIAKTAADQSRFETRVGMALHEHPDDRPLWSGNSRLSAQLVSDVHAVMSPTPLPDVEQALRKTLDPYIYLTNAGEVQLDPFFLNGHVLGWVALPDDVTLALELFLECNGRPAYRGFIWWTQADTPRSPEFAPFPPRRIRMKRVKEFELPPVEERPEWTLRARSDPLVAMRNFDCERYWEGEVIVPLGNRAHQFPEWN